MANAIEEDTPRIGYIYDGMKDTPPSRPNYFNATQELR